jgi:outer membrane immunogenic protein
MKKIILIFGIVLLACEMYAQGPLDKGQGQFNAGVGFSSWGVPMYLGFDVGVHRDITVGGELSFRFYNDRFEGKGYDNSIVGIAGNANYHFNTLLHIPRNFDFYAGLNLGFYVWNTPADYNGPHSSGLGLGAQVGGRYYFNDHFGLNLEFGGGNEFDGGKFGISVRF